MLSQREADYGVYKNENLTVVVVCVVENLQPYTVFIYKYIYITRMYITVEVWEKGSREYAK